MPFVHVKTNRPVSAETERALKAQIGEVIAQIPGKTEKWLMVQVEENAHLWFGGSDAPAAFADVRLFGKASSGDYDRVTAALTEVLAKQLDVAPDRIYIPYQELSHWGWNGGNF